LRPSEPGTLKKKLGLTLASAKEEPPDVADPDAVARMVVYI
jgi:hypothetical protein